ncbi:Small-conductance mechanosensitive channel [Curtobacterium sp. 9128]|uniref:mechanosensitive ion channel domain-containing protein n=1 Tax=Curtobacterium sp. 9128 TaxID=1793722 RepID=UPI0007D716D1|nr:mechanosensitive ion channel domain-containing protein [Curtobacterium sp. 9128]SBN64076.1 Small-conductance mechanosensitive channel [Curtobacterium sp. 9128]
MTPFWQQDWFWPAIVVIIGLPVVLLVLTEWQSNLQRRGNDLHKIIGLLRNAVVPLIAIFILSTQVTEAVDPKEVTANRIIGTVLGFLVIIFVLNGLNIMLFTNARKGTWREKIPSIFVDIARIVLIALGLALVFKLVWNADVGGIFTALGVGSLVIGLALQSAVGPVIAGLFLLFEQPFRLGDWLDAGGARGRVVEVNWRSVHIDTGNGILIMPNSSLAGASFTNLSRTGGTFPVSTEVTFTTDDPPAAVVALLQRIAAELPQKYPGTTPSAVPMGGAAYSVSFEVRGPSQEGDALAVFRLWLWYAARRAGLGLDGDTTDDFVTDERRDAAVDTIAPTLYLGADDAIALRPVVRLERYAAGETIMRPGVVPRALRFVLSGSVELRVPFEDEQLPASRVEAGDYVGQTALTREVVQTNQVALTEVTVLVVPVEAIDTIVRSSPQLAKDIGAVIDRRHQDVADALEARIAQLRAVAS